jgi:hypothetical protein
MWQETQSDVYSDDNTLTADAGPLWTVKPLVVSAAMSLAAQFWGQLRTSDLSLRKVLPTVVVWPNLSPVDIWLV